MDLGVEERLFILSGRFRIWIDFFLCVLHMLTFLLAVHYLLFNGYGGILTVSGLQVGLDLELGIEE